ncbi:CIC11C00000003301 [Sungouiella intermedia]|uniref:CIC11C00000003301 n=1 Tax=Sungouiella intermedia TaxID=45354 RepID=A0A1L0D7X2_9ASCO|nr:CIC11C00000003301 [[Candida] intermedia]
MTKVKRESENDGPAGDRADASTKLTDKPKAYTIKYKRPRGSRACKVCRARKVRCDAEIHIPCTNCITFGCECLLPETRKRGQATESVKRKMLPGMSSEHAVESSPAMTMAATSHPDTATLLSVTEYGLKAELLKMAPLELSLSLGVGPAVLKPIHNISQISVPPSLTSTYKTRPSMHKRDVMKNKRALLTFVGNLSIRVMSFLNGQPHVEMTLELFENTDQSLDLVELEILKLRGAFLLPGVELAYDLIELYFEHVHPLMPVINREEFMRKFKDPDDSPSLMLLQAVLLCGSRVLSNPLLFDSKGLKELASLTFFRRARALYETNYESDPTSILQSVILIGYYWDGPEDVTRNSFYWTRVGVSLAQGFGFHRDISRSDALSATEKKIWRRIWWCLFEKDRNVAIAFGRPTSIDLADCDVPMLTFEDFDESDPELGIVSPYPVNRTHALYFIHLVKLAEITGIIIKHQYTVKAEQMRRINKYSVIQRCDMLMGIWFTNLPPELQFSLTDTLKQNFFACLLNAQYYNRLYLIHRANLVRMARSASTNPNNYKYPSWGISFQSARMISIVSKILLDNHKIRYCPSMFVYILFSALIMLVYHVDSSNQVIASTASDSLFISRAVLKELGKHWAIVSVLIKLFDKQANDKIKRAEMIERASYIHEMEESKSDMEGSRQMHLTTSPTLATSGISPLGGQYSEAVQDAVHAQPVNHSPPDIEQLVRQYKLNGDQNSKETQGEPTTQSGRQSNHETSPSSQHSFPDISLVTEKMPTSQNFYENFEPTQLFPHAFTSVPPSQSHTPMPDGESGFIRPKEEIADSQTPYHGNGLGPNTNMSNGDLFTNFMDSSYINMNLQANVDQDNMLHDDLSTLFNLQG